MLRRARYEVSDVRFNPFDNMCILSTSDDNQGNGGGILQVWRPLEILTYDVERDDDGTGFNVTLEELATMMKRP